MIFSKADRFGGLFSCWWGTRIAFYYFFVKNFPYKKRIFCKIAKQFSIDKKGGL